jgi:outer membrane protein
MFCRILSSALLLSCCLSAQTASFPKPAYFREVFSRTEPKIELQAPSRLQDFVAGGKLELSLKSYLELVMANNTDIQIQKLSVETPKNAILRAFGTFDPLATASFSSTRTKTPSSDTLAGATTLVTLSQPAKFAYSQTLETGASYTASVTGSKATTNSGYSTFNPAINTGIGLSFTQPLIKNRGATINRISISLARSRFRKSEYDLRDNLMRIINDSENAFWDVVQARENLRVQESARDLANEALKRAQRELELGALSPLDIFNPQQQYATAGIGVSQAKFTLQQAENALRKQIGADLDPTVRKLPIVITEPVMPTTEAAAIDQDASIEKAFRMRQDLKSQMQDIDTDDLLIRQAKNGLRPDLSLTGSYTAQGRGGNSYVTDSSTSYVSTIPGGFGDSVSQLFGFGYPVYSFGLTLRLPIRDRKAAADYADAVVTKRQDALQVRTTQQTVRLDVLNAISNVESSKDAVKLALIAQDFARKYLEAEQKKYELGTSQIFFVLQAQSALVAAESTVVQNSVQYRRNVLNLYRKTGELLDSRGIVIQ